MFFWSDYSEISMFSNPVVTLKLCIPEYLFLRRTLSLCMLKFQPSTNMLNTFLSYKPMFKPMFPAKTGPLKTKKERS